MKFVSVCSGIEAASVAWEPLGWTPAAFSEIDPAACAVLQARHPGVPNLGNLREVTDAQVEALRGADVLVGGTPCQSFSVAGLNRGLADPRGGLTLVFLGLLARLRPSWVVWENVPGILSKRHAGAMGSFLGGLSELGYGFAWRVLDARFFGVAQRRRRVFVVGHASGDWRRAAGVLLEPEGLRGDPPPRGAERAKVAAPLASSPSGGSGYRLDADTAAENLIPYPDPAYALAAGQGGSKHGSGREGQDTFVVVDCQPVSDPITAHEQRTYTHEGATFRTRNVVAYRKSRRAHSDDDHETWVEGEEANTLNPYDAKRDDVHAIVSPDARVRRLTPVECERLQGFPDGYTQVPFKGKPMPNSHRYRLLGNSMAVPVMRWIGQRIQLVEATR